MIDSFQDRIHQQITVLDSSLVVMRVTPGYLIDRNPSEISNTSAYRFEEFGIQYDFECPKCERTAHTLRSGAT